MTDAIDPEYVSDDDMLADPSYRAFVRDAMSHCRCCTQCGAGNPPCDGVLAGGMCDEWCTCDDGRDEYWDDE